MKGPLFFAIIAAFAWLLPLMAAKAESAWVHLEWQPPPASSCPRQDWLEQDVEQALGRSVFTRASDAQLRVLGTVATEGTELVVRLQARNAGGALLGSRELRAPAGRCAALRDDIGFVLTLLVERDAYAAAPSPPVRLRLHGGLWGGFLVNVLPRGNFGAGPALALDLGAWLQLRADAAYWLPISIRTARDIRSDLHAGTLALRLCVRLVGAERSFSSVHVCAGVQGGALINVQTRPRGPGSQVRLLAQGLLEARSSLRLWGPSRLELAVAPLLSLKRTTIESVRDDGTRVPLYQSPLLGVLLSLALII